MKHTVLIAERDNELGAAYRRFLSSCGYLALTATDGIDCLEKLRRLTPAVIVLDPDLRWGGGDGVLAWLREEDPTHTIPVILTPTAGCRWDNARCTEPRIVECLPKPFGLPALLDSVRSAIARGAPGQHRAGVAPALAEVALGPSQGHSLRIDPSRAGEEPLAQAVRRHIEMNTWGRIRELEVELSVDRVIVHGYSPSYYLVQRALLAVREVFPSKPVNLNIQIGRSAPTPGRGVAAPQAPRGVAPGCGGQNPLPAQKVPNRRSQAPGAEE